MGKSASPLPLCVGLAAGLLILAGCRRTGTNAPAVAEPAATRQPAETAAVPAVSPGGPLRVLGATPQGPVASPSQSDRIVVIFDRPMTALQALPEGEGPALLRFEPPAGGQSRWLGTRALAFTPAEPLPFATEYRVTVPAGTASLDGAALAKDFTWTFQTLRPRLLRHFPEDGQEALALDTRILLIFNQAVRRDEAAAHIAWLAKGPQGGRSEVAFTVRRPEAKTLEAEHIEASPEAVLLLEPRRPLEPEHAYTVVVEPGLPATGGPLGLPEGVSFAFRTYERFALSEFAAPDGHNPAEPIEIEFTNPVAYDELAAKIGIEPALIIPAYYEEWEQASRDIWLNLPLEPETEYAVRFPADLRDEFGNALGREQVFRFRTGPLPPDVSMTTGHGVLESYGDLQYPFVAVNVPSVRVRAALVPPDRAVAFLQAERLFWSNQAHEALPGFFVLDETRKPGGPRNERRAHPIDLSGLLPGGSGLVFLELEADLPGEEERWFKAFLQVTALGLSAKFSPERNLVWATELRTGRPVAGAAVELRGADGAVLFTGITDEQGLCETPGWKALGLRGRDEWSQPEQWLLVRRDADTALVSSDWGTGIYPWRFGIQYEWHPRPAPAEGYLFTDRGIYRAGETAHLKGILRRRERGGWALPAAAEAVCRVEDPFQKKILERTVALDEFGSFAIDVETGEDAALGQYQVAVEVPAADKGGAPATIFDSFRIEAFRPAEFEVHLRTPRDAHVFGDEYTGEIRANFLSGGPLARQPGEWRLRLDPTRYEPPGHEGFTFGNTIDWTEPGDEAGFAAEESRLLASGEGTLDAEGSLRVRAKLVPEEERDTVTAVLEATVTSPSRRAISSRIGTLVHRGEFYVGLRPATAFLRQGEKLPVDVVAAFPDGRPADRRKIGLRLIRREWRSVRKAGVGGRFRWESEREDVEVAAESLTSRRAPVSVTFAPDKSGFYILAASARDGRRNEITTSLPFYVTGSDYVPWLRRDDDTIELVADRNEYKPGETARLLVKSPYEKVRALVTLERELVLDSRVVDITGSTAEIAVPILESHAPNVFVSVILVDGRSARPAEIGGPARGDDPGKPSFKIGYAELKVNPAERRLNVTLETGRAEYRPRDRVAVKVRVTDAAGRPVRASVTLAAADVGVLNLIGYRTPDPFGLFYAPRPLSVQTSETRIHVVGQREYGEKGEDAGGGGVEASLAAPAFPEVEMRGDFRATALWQPSLLTGPSGEAEAVFELPDNLTTFRVMAAAQTADSRFGRADTTFRVSKPLLLLPSLPRFLRAGDVFKAGVIVRNLSGRSGRAMIAVRAGGLVPRGPAETAIDLEDGASREVLFDFAAESAGEAGFAFQAKMNDAADGLELTIPIRATRPAESTAVYGRTEEAAEETIVVPEEAVPGDSRLVLTAAPTALAGLAESLEYLTRYPYLCLEQRLSAILPYLTSPELVRDFGLSPMPAAESRAFVASALRDIYAYQTDEGGFAMWPGGPRPSPFLTAYAVFGLLEAKRAGFEVADHRLESGLGFLGRLLRERKPEERYPYGARAWKTTLAFALYDLARSGRPEPAFAERLFAERSDLTIFGQTLLLKALHHAEAPARTRRMLRDEIMNRLEATPGAAHFEEPADPGLEWIYASNVRTTAAALQALVETGSSHPLVPDMARWLVDRRRAGRWRTTQDNAFVLYALGGFYRVLEDGPPDYAYAVRLAGRPVIEAAFRSLTAATTSAEAPLDGFAPGERLTLRAEKQGRGILYYGARLTYIPARPVPAREEGLTVVKRITTTAGRPVDVVAPGDLVVVTLEVVLPQELLFVVVDDPLPAGFEAVNPAFLTESEEDRRTLAELGRRDETPPWQGFTHVEMRDDRVVLFADSLPAGVQTHRYLARALTPGRFRVPGVAAEQMYAPEVFGRAPEMTVIIGK